MSALQLSNSAVLNHIVLPLACTHSVASLYGSTGAVCQRVAGTPTAHPAGAARARAQRAHVASIRPDPLNLVCT